MIKEQRSISHSAIMRDGLSTLLHKHQLIPPPSNRDLLNSISNNESSTASMENKLKFNKLVDQFITKSGSYNNNNNIQNQDDCVGESIQVLQSIRSVRTLKSLQNERMMRKSSRQRGDENECFTPEHKGNDIRNSISRIEANQRLEAKNSCSVRNQSVQQSHQYGITIFADKHHSQNELLAIPPTAALKSKHVRQQSKSSQNLIHMPPGCQNHTVFTRQQQNQFNTKRASMAKGERQSFGSDQSVIDDIPSEGVCRFSSGDNSIRISQLNQLNPGQNKMQELVAFSSRFQVSGPNLKQQAHQLFSINTVRDSSPLKTITQCQADTKMFRSIKPSATQLTDRSSNGANRENHELYSHFFPRHHSSSQVQVARTYGGVRLESKDVSASFKQPKQGTKKAAIIVQEQYLTENINRFEQQPHDIDNRFTNGDSQNNLNNPNLEIQSIEDDHISDESPSNTLQSIHIPKTLALQRSNSKIYTNLTKENCHTNSLSSSTNPKQSDRSNLKNQQTAQEHHNCQLQYNPLLSNLYNARPQKKESNNLRTESLERILGDKAESFFSQMEKMQRKEFVKVNRSTNFDKENSGAKNFATKQAYTQQQQSMMLLSNGVEDEKHLEQVNLNQKNQLLGQDQLTNKNSAYISEGNFTNNILNEAKSSQFQVFPASVKDKIKNITSRIKHEILKQEEYLLGQRKKTGGAGTAANDSQNTIQSIYYKDQFRKYLNVDKQEELQKSQRYQERSILQQKQQKGKENVQGPLVCKTERTQATNKGKRVFSPCRLPNGKSSLLQQKKPLTAGDNKSKAKVQQANTQNNNKINNKIKGKGAAQSYRKQSDGQCIIYAAPSKFPEILTTQENIEEDILSPHVITKSSKQQQHQHQPIKESNNNFVSEGSPFKLREASTTSDVLNKENEKVIGELEDYFQQSLQHKAEQEALIKSKLSHLLKETRTKMKKYEDIKLAALSKENTPTSKLSHIFSSSVSLNLSGHKEDLDQQYKQQELQRQLISSSFRVNSPQRSTNQHQQQFFLNSNPFTPSNKKQLEGCYQGEQDPMVAGLQKNSSIDKLEYSPFSEAPFAAAQRNQMHSQQVIRGDEIISQNQSTYNNNNTHAQSKPQLQQLQVPPAQQQFVYVNNGGGMFNSQALMQNSCNMIQFETSNLQNQQQQLSHPQLNNHSRFNQQQNNHQMAAAYGYPVYNHLPQQYQTNLVYYNNNNQQQQQNFGNYPQQLTPMAQSMQQLNQSALLAPPQKLQQQLPSYQQASFHPQYNQDGYYSNSSNNLLGLPGGAAVYFIPSNDTSMHLPPQQLQQQYSRHQQLPMAMGASSMNNFFPQTTVAAGLSLNAHQNMVNPNTFLSHQPNPSSQQQPRISLITKENLKQFNAQPDNHKATIQFKVDKALCMSSRNDDNYN